MRASERIYRARLTGPKALHGLRQRRPRRNYETRITLVSLYNHTGVPKSQRGESYVLNAIGCSVVHGITVGRYHLRSAARTAVSTAAGLRAC